jgi:hypothetical protein
VNFHRLGSLAAFVILAMICLVAGYGLRAIYAPEWMLLDTTQHPPAMRPWAVEADCYSQLARVQRILKGQGLIQNHFTVENWPEGLVPSTTAPFDYVILLLYAPLALVTKHPLDWAGALVSPALWIGLVFFWMLFRSREFNLAGRALLLIGSTALPAFIWATACGRPRHQSLILALMAMGLTAEYERWQIELSPKRAWNVFAGVVWGLACWTSLFEPAVVVTSLILFNLIVRRRENVRFLLSFGIVMLVALLIEGVHVFVPPEQYLGALQRWLGTIAEVQGIGFNTFIQQMTFLSFVTLVPFVSWRLWRRAGDRRTDLFLILLTVLLAVLMFVQKRWVYYANLAELFLIVRYCQLSPLRWTRLVVLAIFLFGIAYDNALQIQGRIHAPANQPSLQMLQISNAMDGPGAIMAPWWLSPGLLYFSGQPIVSGSSHCGISGIVASAKFYAGTSFDEAARILEQRKVRWVVVWDDPVYDYPLLNSSRGILGLPYASEDDKGDADATVAQILIADQPGTVPADFQLRGVTSLMKLYEFVPEAGKQ